ncbi:uncharacterized protein LAJ45_06415 [Morchella importuna]|uniref:uncharacterized protein n=1 Tax=Morchella importuna TaxID=1174673 RepID=UPI001E8D8A22|nr:uncharacterized protein LAJ45_06415 [Morchella importuna]KAH8149336.1 hypothetical protein LAJ45_06415 [Morchella importuna]
MTRTFSNSAYIWPLLLFVLLVYLPLASADIQYADFHKCCKKARDQFYDTGNSQNNNTYTCGASFDDGKDAALPIYVSLTWCRAECGGFQPSRVSKNHLNEILSPLVGFLIPALVFSISIPRGWQLRIPERLFKEDWFTARGSMNLILAMVIVMVETLRWITVVFVCAGPILVGGLYEMLLDHRLLRELALLQEPEGASTRVDRELRRRRILVALLLGNLNIKEGKPKEGAEQFIVNASEIQAKARLHSLLESQGSFGAIVGSPVIFYVGSFIYALIDALKNLGDNDTSHAIALGIWYSVFVIVAIVCGCLLGCNNPAALEGIVSKIAPPKNRGDSASEVFLSRYKPVSIWDRGVSTYKWAKANGLEGYLGTNTSIYLTGLSAAILMSAPCWLAFLVSFETPEIGLGCRSFMFFLYWVSQVELIGIFVIRQTIGKRPGWPKWAKKLINILRGFAFMLAFLSGVGGTVMQLTGVFRNCICKAGVRSFINPNGNYTVQLATDTELDRKMARSVWMLTGGCSLGVLVLLCLYAWWYQTNIRQKCSQYIHNLSSLPLMGDKLMFFKLRASMEEPRRPYREFIQAPVPNGFLQLGPESSCGEFQICQTTNSDIARRHLAVTVSDDSRLYLHIVERDSPLLTGALELTWETTPNKNPSGDFVWQGNRLAWRTIDESYLDGFFIGSSIGEADRVYLNAVAYGMDPITPVPIQDVTHFTLHRVKSAR